MQIKSLELKNIRSYEQAKINFSPGITLFEGDIGSGKSTILMAIEFALFGLGSEKGAALLRIGSDNGHVYLTFQVDGQEYIAYRALSKKKRGIQQSKCFIEKGGVKSPLSPTEMKERILKILNFNEPPNSRAKSLIYRYAVFTPQEEMKAIISMSADQRLQTLRKALRLEDYKIAMNNARELGRRIDRRSVELVSQAKDLDMEKGRLGKKIDEQKNHEEKLSSLYQQLKPLQEEYNKLKEDISYYQNTMLRLESLKGQLDPIKEQLQQNLMVKDQAQDDIKKYTEEIENIINPEIQDIKEKIVEPEERNEETLYNQLNNLDANERNLRDQKANLNSKIRDYEAIENNSICPTCKQPIDPEDIRGKLEPLYDELKDVEQKISDCENHKKIMQKKLEQLKTFEINRRELKHFKERLKDRINTIESLRTKINELSETITGNKDTIRRLEEEISRGQGIKEKVNRLEAEEEEKNKNIQRLQEKISSTKTAIKMIKEDISELNEKIKKKENLKKQGDTLKEYYIWLNDFFIPTLENIENQVMQNINQEFNQHFQRWFNLLVDETEKNAYIDEEFTPIVEQDGYEQEIEYLSGGEKTSVALAYRLALNSIVQKISTGIKSEMLILDEPTDGFSKEQLFKLREILEELECPQIILVSHEKELESFADHIFTIEKVDGNSIIS